MNYYSQYKQDELLNEQIFRNMKNGVFVDIGAHDRVCFSNSLFFEKELNWSGICIEPNPDVYKLLRENRNCLCINRAIYNKTGKIDFQKNSGRTELLSGIVEKYDPEHIKRIEYENSVYGGDSSVISVNSYILNDILKENNIRIIDYLTIDTEGSEYEILSSIDYSEIKINVIDVEFNYVESEDSKKIYKLLEDNGFYLAGQLGCDFIFVNSDLKFTN